MMKRKRRVTQAYFKLAYHQYTPLIQQLAFRMGINKTQVEELKVQAAEELLKCMICYNPSNLFITFFYGRLIDIFRHMKDTEKRARRIQTMSLDSMTNVAGPDYDMDSHMMVEEVLEYLDKDERSVITELFFNGKTMREISNEREVVTSTVYRIKIRAINKIRQKCQMGWE
jgi:RNA polymerase sigma factor (sigma-70 family)